MKSRRSKNKLTAGNSKKEVFYAQANKKDVSLQKQQTIMS